MHPAVPSRRVRAALFASLALAGCGGGDAEARGPGAPGADDASATPVAVEIARPTELRVALRGTANLRARQQVEVLPKQAGVVARVVAEEGQRVAAGSPLAVLDDEEWRLQERQAAAQLDASRAAAERASALRERGLISAEEAEQLRTAFEVDRANYGLAQLRVRNAVIRSPIAGVVTHRYAERGQLLSQTTPAYAVAETDRLEAIVGIPEREAPRVDVGQVARVTVEGLGEPVPARVARVRPVVDPESGTVQVTVEVADGAARGLRPGQFVNAEIFTETLTDRVTLPRTAVLVDGPQPRVLLVRAGEAVEVPVQTGANEGERVEIRSGVEPGDTVVVVGQEGLREGSAVRIVEMDGADVDIAPPSGAGANAGGRLDRLEARLRELGVDSADAARYRARIAAGERQQVMAELAERGIEPSDLFPGGAPGGRGGRPGGGRGR